MTAKKTEKRKSLKIRDSLHAKLKSDAAKARVTLEVFVEKKLAA